MSTPKLNLYPITGINMYELPFPEMVEQFKHAVNDSEYPEHLYKGQVKQESQSTSNNQSNQSNVSSSSHSDTPTVVALHPIRDR
jgi:hypothetical protein